ncbi:hypothetical protein CW368_12365 [Actinomycetales bacterium SN12]|nr:hypothetical protein CW368_12365 [Actinomycetales bacterium SN12]
MKEDFLRPPHTASEWTADALRVIGILGVIAAVIWLKPTDAGIAALALPALMLPRMLGMRAWFDVAAGATVLAAAWSNVFDLYAAISWWDLAVHFACTAVLAILAAEILTRADVVGITTSARPRSRTPLVLAPLIALALSAVWEMIEWFGSVFISDQIHVGYQDTIGDMVLGGLGGVAAGMMLALIDVRRVPDDVASAPRAILSSRRG